MGTRGPIPKPIAERRRTNKPEVPIIQAPSDVALPAWPEPNEDWHPMAREWFADIGRSGQAQFYEPSDVSQARIWAHIISAELFKDRASAVMVAAWDKGAGELGTTIGARRRMGVELERVVVTNPGQEHADATVTDLKSRLRGGA